MQKLITLLLLIVANLFATHFEHPAIASWDKQQKAIYTAYSKHNFYARMWISSFVVQRGCLPLNPFMVFDFGLMGAVDIDQVRLGNNTMIRLADEVWVFGVISDGVLAEIFFAQKLGKPVRFFGIGATRGSSSCCAITEAQELTFEPGLESYADQIGQKASIP